MNPDDEVQFAQVYSATVPFLFITTAGHGYLAVPKDAAPFWTNAARKADTGFGYQSENHYFLEEDCELANFLNITKNANDIVTV